MNNRCLGMVNDMEIGRGGKYDMGDTPDISLIAKAYGVNSERVELSDNIEEKIYRFLSAPDSALIEIMFDNSEVTR